LRQEGKFKFRIAGIANFFSRVQEPFMEISCGMFPRIDRRDECGRDSSYR
jgi:hypothetical protein